MKKIILVCKWILLIETVLVTILTCLVIIFADQMLLYKQVRDFVQFGMLFSFILATMWLCMS